MTHSKTTDAPFGTPVKDAATTTATSTLPGVSDTYRTVPGYVLDIEMTRPHGVTISEEIWCGVRARWQVDKAYRASRQRRLQSDELARLLGDDA